MSSDKKYVAFDRSSLVTIQICYGGKPTMETATSSVSYTSMWIGFVDGFYDDEDNSFCYVFDSC